MEDVGDFSKIHEMMARMQDTVKKMEACLERIDKIMNKDFSVSTGEYLDSMGGCYFAGMGFYGFEPFKAEISFHKN